MVWEPLQRENERRFLRSLNTIGIDLGNWRGQFWDEAILRQKINGFIIINLSLSFRPLFSFFFLKKKHQECDREDILIGFYCT